MTRKADPPTRRPSRRKQPRRQAVAGLATQATRPSKARGLDEKLDCDFGLAFQVVPALRRPPDA